MHVVQRPVGSVRRLKKRMYLPSERNVVNGVGLGELDGMFNIGKMFTRMFTFTPSSFKLKNIAGAIGSAVSTFGTFGIANVASEIAGPSGLKLTKGTITGAHSKIMEYTGYAAVAAAAAVGAVYAAPLVGSALGIGGTAATGTALTTVGTTAASTAASTGIMGTVGSVISSVGSGVWSVAKGIMSVIPLLGGMMGGGGVGGQNVTVQGADPYAQQYAQQVAEQQAAMYTPGGYSPSIPYAADQYSGSPLAPSVGGSYGDLRTPYTAIPEDGGPSIAINPATGQPIVAQSGISTPMLVGGGLVVVLLGMYLMSDDK